ncbi:MAG: DNA-binding response regulator [Bacteroidaceae bacterium]|nr:DNA-binding response regulator [Bacteroidaceae bacterium]
MIQAHILIIDDNVAVLQSLRLVLKSVFSTVAAVDDPTLIPAIISKESIDVVLLDMNFGKGKMDGKDGLFWLDRIKHRSGLDNPPAVVLITAFGDVNLAVDSLKQGADDFIQKPWDNAQLIQKLTEAVEKRSEKMKESRIRNEELGGRSEGDSSLQSSIPKASPLTDLEREHIRKVLADNGGKVAAAAKVLGISRQALYDKMKRYGLP